MAQRSIHIDCRHQNPIPNAYRIGSFVLTSVLIGTEPETGELPTDLNGRTNNLFTNIRQVAKSAGGSKDDIIKLPVRLADLDDRAALNRAWLAMHPNLEASGPPCIPPCRQCRASHPLRVHYGAGGGILSVSLNIAEPLRSASSTPLSPLRREIKDGCAGPFRRHDESAPT